MLRYRRDGRSLRQEQQGTTVATTMITGHIGGNQDAFCGICVHRGVEETMDISAGLRARVKLNTSDGRLYRCKLFGLTKNFGIFGNQGVPVVGYQTDYLPAPSTHSLSLKQLVNRQTRRNCGHDGLL